MDSILNDLFMDLLNMKMSHYFSVKDESLVKDRAVANFVKSMNDSLRRLIDKRSSGGNDV